MNENPVGFEVMMDNTLDPAHANFVHDGLLQKRDAARAMTMSIKPGGGGGDGGFVVQHGPYSSTQGQLIAERAFEPPGAVRCILYRQTHLTGVVMLGLTDGQVACRTGRTHRSIDVRPVGVGGR
jgi:phenylpropionate dioxygenase-like ring-hydroxylating dioxygenase large terminal subunit